VSQEPLDHGRLVNGLVFGVNGGFAESRTATTVVTSVETPTDYETPFG
jgi:hypothetical protein